VNGIPPRGAMAPARHLGMDALFVQVARQLGQTAKLEIAPEDESHPFGLLLVDDKSFVLDIIAERHGRGKADGGLEETAMLTSCITVRRSSADGVYSYHVAEAYPPGQVIRSSFGGHSMAAPVLGAGRHAAGW
jgi:hypothetical protein